MAEVPPLVGMAGKPGVCHHRGEASAAVLPVGRLGSGSGRGGRGVMMGFRDRADGVDGTPHGQEPPCGVGQGEIHGAAGAVGGRGCGIQAGLGPEAGHRLHHRLPGRSFRMDRIETAGPAFLGDAVLHHEPLHGHGSPGVEDRQPPALST